MEYIIKLGNVMLFEKFWFVIFIVMNFRYWIWTKKKLKNDWRLKECWE